MCTSEECTMRTMRITYGKDKEEEKARLRDGERQMLQTTPPMCPWVVIVTVLPKLLPPFLPFSSSLPYRQLLRVDW